MRKPTIAVTGANGFLGKHIVAMYLKQSCEVISLVRNVDEARIIPELKGSRISSYTLDSVDSIKNSIKGASIVIHTAAIHNRGSALKQQIQQTNVVGTENVIKALDNIDKFVFVSSIRSMMTTKKSLISEEDEYDFKKFDTPYGSSKYQAEQLCLSYHRNYKLPLYLVNPAVIIGPNDTTPSYNGKLIFNHLQQKIVFVTPAYWSIVDVRDVARSIPFILSKGKPAERHIVCPASLTLLEFFKKIDEFSHQKKLYITIPYLPLKTAGILFECLEKILPGFDPPIVSSGADIAWLKIHFSGNKLKKMGFRYNNLDDTLRDTVNWFLDGYET